MTFRKFSQPGSLALAALTLFTIGCSDKGGDDTGAISGDTANTSGDTSTTDTEPPLTEQESLSSFDEGKYRSDVLVLLDTEEGIDLNGDKEPDNKLPNVLATVDLLGLIDADLSLEGVNATLAAALEAEDIIQLIDARQDGALLTVDLLLGVADKKGALSIDDASYEGGEPTSRLEGEFASETSYTVYGDVIQIPFTFIPGDPPLFIPVVNATLVGDLDSAATGKLYGAIPVTDMMAQVIEPLIPTGDDYDPSQYLNQERDEFLEGIEGLANKQLADIELEDGSKAVSAALSFTASGSAW